MVLQFIGTSMGTNACSIMTIPPAIKTTQPHKPIIRCVMFNLYQGFSNKNEELSESEELFCPESVEKCANHGHCWPVLLLDRNEHPNPQKSQMASTRKHTQHPIPKAQREGSALSVRVQDKTILRNLERSKVA
eukprot:1345180-Amphidinium_carterae.1